MPNLIFHVHFSIARTRFLLASNLVSSTTQWSWNGRRILKEKKIHIRCVCTLYIWMSLNILNAWANIVELCVCLLSTHLHEWFVSGEKNLDVALTLNYRQSQIAERKLIYWYFGIFKLNLNFFTFFTFDSTSWLIDIQKIRHRHKNIIGKQNNKKNNFSRQI